ncbi:MAG: nucleoside deaminase [Bacteroidales bacterium]|nr:nucleoside deaminase [Bacteroidales bacterium]MCF8392184.1 nucleoside deaminase [Bacteroidales bacterium]
MERNLLKKAIDLAKANVDKGGGPFGALIVKDGLVISKAANLVTLKNDPTAHAEVLAIRKAAKKLGTWNLEGCELYTSCEPCPMCMGAVYWAHLDKVYYASGHNDAKKAGFDDSEIYSEMRKEVKDRKISMQQEMREEGNEAFLKWMEKVDKEEY